MSLNHMQRKSYSSFRDVSEVTTDEWQNESKSFILELIQMYFIRSALPLFFPYDTLYC
jgi:hypothetical protein